MNMIHCVDNGLFQRLLLPKNSRVGVRNREFYINQFPNNTIELQKIQATIFFNIPSQDNASLTDLIGLDLNVLACETSHWP